MKLTPQQIEELEEELRSEDVKKYADRIRVILLLAKKWSPSKIAEALFLDPSTIHRYRNSYLEGGLEKLIHDGFIGRRSKLTDSQKQELSHHIKAKPPQSTKEVIDFILGNFGIKYSVSGMTSILHSLGFSYKKPKSVSPRRDSLAQEQFVEKLEELRENIGEREKILFADAAHPEMNGHAQYGWFPKGERAEVKGDAQKIRQNILGAINVDELDSSFRSYNAVNKYSVLDFLAYIERKNKHLARIYLVVDNAPYFSSKFVRERLKKRNSKIVLIYLPPYSPNLNPIERFWKFLHKKILNNKYFTSQAKPTLKIKLLIF